MNKLQHTLVSRATLSFTLAVVFSALYNLSTNHLQCDYLFLLEILGLIVCLELIDYVFNHISFNSRILYLCTEYALMYVCFLIFSFIGHWFSFTSTNLIFFSSIFVIFFDLLHFYSYCLLKTEANNINNHLLKKKI
ncbi:DUF3021 family protein [Acetobacterium tundrae]|uniref:DUF3021 family protein n=1 Tax=Acetobacterium tundrae TaxID=132932 RepID=A0ABR6WPT5_9FIRM|nr:DUF3021 family protein [Acetobacterium tundrae]